MDKTMQNAKPLPPIANINAIHLGDTRMEYLFGGQGLPYDLESPARIMLSGETGTGKTTFLAQIIHETLYRSQKNAHRNPIAVLFCQEETPIEIVRVIGRFGWLEGIKVFVYEDDKLKQVCKNEREGGNSSSVTLVDAEPRAIQENGGLVLASLTPESLDVYKDSNGELENSPDFPCTSQSPFAAEHVLAFEYFLDERLPEKLGVDGKQIQIIAIDGLNSIIHAGANPARPVVDAFIKTPFAMDKHAIYTFEASHHHDVESYLVDIVARLGKTESGKRYVRFDKARRIDIRPLTHTMEIVDPGTQNSSGSGIVIYPNIELVTSVCLNMKDKPEWKQEAKNRREKFLSTGIENLDNVLSPPGQNGIQCTSSTLYFGQPVTRKILAGVQFLLAAIKEKKLELGAQLLYFDEWVFMKNRHVLWAQRECGEKGLSFFDAADWFADKAQIIEACRTAVLDKNWKRTCDVVLVRDLQALEERFSWEETRELVRTMLHLFGAFHITPLFIHTREEMQKERSYVDLFDNVFIFQRVAESERSQHAALGVYVSKALGLARTPTLFELDMDEKAEDAFELRAVPGALEELVEVAHGTGFKLGPLTLWMYAEKKSLKAFYEKYAHDLIDPVVNKGPGTEVTWQYFEPRGYCPAEMQVSAKDSGTLADKETLGDSEATGQDANNKVGVATNDKNTPRSSKTADQKHSPEQVFKGLLAHSHLPVRERTDVITVDEYLVGKMLEHERLVNLTEVNADFTRNVFNNFRESTLKTITRADAVYGVPFYVNLSLLVWRRDLIEGCSKEINKKYTLEESNYVDHVLDLQESRVDKFRPPTWKELTEIGEIVKKGNEDRDIRTFDAFYVGQECLTSLIIEFLWDCILEKFDPEKHAKNKKKGLAVERIEWGFKKILKYEEFSKSVRMLKDKLLEGKRVGSGRGKDVVFTRCWHTSVSELLENLNKNRHGRGEIGLDQLGYTFIPVCHSRTESPEGSQCRNLRGDFFLCVLSGSLNPRRGLSAIWEMTDESAASWLYTNQAALPARNSFWHTPPMRESAHRQLDLIDKMAISRGSIYNYDLAKDLLFKAFADLLEQDGKVGEEAILHCFEIVRTALNSALTQ